MSGSDHIVILGASGKVYTMGVARQGQLGRVNERKSERGSCRDTKGISPPWTVGKRTTTQYLQSILVPQPVPSRKLKKVTAGPLSPRPLPAARSLYSPLLSLCPRPVCGIAAELVGMPGVQLVAAGTDMRGTC